jgi:hypothetical protein
VTDVDVRETTPVADPHRHYGAARRFPFESHASQTRYRPIPLQ